MPPTTDLTATNEPREGGWCFLCRRFATRRLLNADYVCDECWAAGEEGPDIPLDMTDLNLEGQPEFNGAFNRW